ncbi:WWOX [Symbiodinium sp. CCMP2456]|nr:WWOX [Symbiodinium sp. CCMP2456]
MQPLLAEMALLPLRPEIQVPGQSVFLDTASLASAPFGPGGQKDRGLRRCGFFTAALGGAAWIRSSARRAVQRRARRSDALEAASPRRSALTFLGLTGFLAGGATARAEHLATLTADTLKDAAGKVVVITGATAGVGLEAARTLVAAGAEVYVTGRTLAKAQAAVAEITKEAVPGKAIPLELNLASLSSVRAFVSGWSSEIKRPIDILACNAGLALGTDAKVWVFDFLNLPDLRLLSVLRTVGTNHLGHFLLAPWT